MLRLVSAVLILISCTGIATAKRINPIPENNQEDVLDLGVFEFTSPRVPLELRKETSLRFIRKALKEPYSVKVEDWDKMRCWLGQVTGTRFQHLICGTNRSISHQRYEARARVKGQALFSPGSFGKIYVRQLGDTSSSLDARMAILPDNDYFDEAFVTISSNGGTPPKDVPTEAELIQFLNAWFRVDALGKANKPEQQLINAITSAGLSLQRYNRIVELSGTFPSIQSKVEQLAQTQ